MRRVLPLLFCTLLAGCGGFSREARIDARLERAGMKPKLARCVAHKLDERLSDDQLAELGEALRHVGGGRLHAGDAVARVEAIDDPRLVETVSRAMLGCSIIG